MSLYTISDLHLPIGINKPMDVFGAEWENYVERLENNWRSKIKEDDTVVMPGDFSWATYLEQAVPDFEFVNSLPGKKILLKGNHDYWWETVRKMDRFLEEHGFASVRILNNCAFMYRDIALCGNRGWNVPETEEGEDYKIYMREVNRLRLSLEEAKKENPREIYVFTHFPPVSDMNPETQMSGLMQEYGVSRCYYGHLHAGSKRNAVRGMRGGIEYSLVSADNLDFDPLLITE